MYRLGSGFCLHSTLIHPSLSSRMATAERSSPKPEALPVLHELRSRIRRYVVLEGSALVLVVLGVAFWISLAIDYGLEPSLGVRRALLLAVLAAVGAAVVWYL